MLSTAACAAAAAAETWAWDADEIGGELDGEWEEFNAWGCGSSGGDKLLLIELSVVFDATEEGNVTVGGGEPDNAGKYNRAMIIYLAIVWLLLKHLCTLNYK